MTADWPTEARDAVCHALHRVWQSNSYDVTADAVLAALAPHVQPRTDDWEWAVRWNASWPGVTRFEVTDEQTARAKSGAFTAVAAETVRRRPAGEWEVAP